MPATLNAIEVFEPEEPADGAGPVIWRLLTTLPVSNAGDARKVIDFYRLRQRIECWHRILKSGCKVENTSHQSSARLQRAVSINAVIAWRIAALTHLGRVKPDLPVETAFSDIELILLEDFAHKRRRPPPRSLGEVFRLVAAMGGHLDRADDQPPGHQVTWTGCAALSFAAWLVSFSQERGAGSRLAEYLEQDACLWVMGGLHHCMKSCIIALAIILYNRKIAGNSFFFRAPIKLRNASLHLQAAILDQSQLTRRRKLLRPPPVPNR